MTSQDAAPYRALRLEGLIETPEAFGGAHEDELRRPFEDFVTAIARNTVFGAFAANGLVGMAAFSRLEGRHMEHRGNLFSVYISPDYRGQGLGATLVEAVLAHARLLVRQVHLYVGTWNAPAIRLYERAGFERYGTEPRSLFVNGRFIDEHLMVRFLDKAPGEDQ